MIRLKILSVVVVLLPLMSVMPTNALIPMTLNNDWDSAYSYSFDYEKILNHTNAVSKRISFSAIVRFRKFPDSYNSVLATFDQPIYNFNDQYNRNPFFRVTVDGLTLPFRINYNIHGLLENVVTHELDSELSAKIKKTVASLVQFDWEYMDYMMSRKYYDYNFTTPENTIFGECTVINYINQVGEGRILTKDILLHTCIKNKPYSRSSLTVEFKFKSSREKDFHFVSLNGIEYVPGSETYSVLSQRLDFKENVKAWSPIDTRRIRIDRVVML